MFIIPMAGLSSRFFKAGYDKPKYQLMLGDETVFAWSVRSFERYFHSDKFVFIYRDVFDTTAFLHSELAKLGIRDYELVCLPEETLGQADTVYQGLQNVSGDDAIYIFNIDSKIVNFLKPQWVMECAGYLEVFRGEGDHWSFAQTLPESRQVIRTTEKERISDLCSDGLYYFASKSLFQKTFEYAKQNQLTVKNEYYIAPLYNILIQQNHTIYCDIIENQQILFCGTPQEYENLLAKQEK